MMTSNLRLILMIALISLWSRVTVPAQAHGNHPKVKQRKAFFTELVREYHSEGIRRIWESDPGERFEAYVEGHRSYELVEEFETIIHELLHGLDSREASFGNRFYLHGAEEGTTVKMNEVFSSRELNGLVPAGIQDSIFRYATYVAGRQSTAQFGDREITINDGGKYDISSVSEGIFGLAEEFNAYYWGTLTAWELLPWYEAHFSPEDQKVWSDYRHTLLGNVAAYHEFRLFVAWYLIHARQKHPEIFGKLMANEELRRAFTRIESQYADLILEIEEKLPELDRRSGPSAGDYLNLTGSDEELRKFLADNGVDPEEMGLKPGTGEWEVLRAEYLAALGEAKASVEGKLDFFHSQPKAQISYLKGLMGEKEMEILGEFRLQD